MLEKRKSSDVWVIFNGPSSSRFHGVPNTGIIYACNYAYRDFPVTYLYAVDRIAVHNIRKDRPRCECWTKKSPLELPHGWNHAPTPGIDSGSFALEQACLRETGRLVIIGADGILGLDSTTNYDYHWRTHQPSQRIHQRHRTTVEQIIDCYNPNYVFITNKKDTLRTMTFEQYIDITD